MSENESDGPLFRAMQHTSVADAFRQQLLALIREGRLKPGTRLPPEKELIVEFGVSRPALRETIHTLVGLGLLEVRRGQGTYVRAPTSATAIRPDVVSLLLQTEDLKDLQDIRRILEPELAARVAERATEEELDELEVILDDMERATGRDESTFESAWAFHRGLAQAVGNPALATIMAILYEMLRTAEAPLYEQHFDARRDIHEHRLLLSAIRTREPAMARAAMLQHINVVADGLSQVLEQAVPRPAGSGPALNRKDSMPVESSQ